MRGQRHRKHHLLAREILCRNPLHVYHLQPIEQILVPRRASSVASLVLLPISSSKSSRYSIFSLHLQKHSFPSTALLRNFQMKQLLVDRSSTTLLGCHIDHSQLYSTPLEPVK
jgi:hypothetical protein